MAKFKYLGMTLPNQNFMYEEIKNILYLGSTPHRLVQNLLFSYLRSMTVNIKMYRTVFLPVFFFFLIGVKLDVSPEGKNTG